jgi:hypothetical protein
VVTGSAGSAGSTGAAGSVPDVRPGAGERVAVTVLGALLPAGFRARQRAEWAADLVALASGGTQPHAGQRWRYLFWAAWTLPALRAAARRAGLSGGDRAAGATAKPAGVTVAMARVLLIGLGWPVVSWLVAVPGLYYLFDVPGRIVRRGLVDPKDLWPTGWLFFVLYPLIVLLILGTYVALIGGPLLVASLCLAFVAVAVTMRRASGRLRASLAIGGTAVLALALCALSSSMFSADPGNGYFIGVLGAVSIALAPAGSGLKSRTRIALVLVGLGAAAVCGAQLIGIANPMTTWFLD